MGHLLECKLSHYFAVCIDDTKTIQSYPRLLHQIMAGLELFASILIDESVKSALPDSYILRPLSRDDYAKGFFENLQALTSTGEVNGETFMARFDYMKAKEDVFYNIVVESKENKIVANGMSIVESKFIWNLGENKAMLPSVTRFHCSSKYKLTFLPFGFLRQGWPYRRRMCVGKSSEERPWSMCHAGS